MSSRRGVLALVLLLTVLGTIVLFAAVRLRQPFRSGASQKRMLVFDVPSDIDEGAPPYSAFSVSALRRDRPSFFELLFALHRAESDKDIVGLVLHVGSMDWGWARVHEMRAAVASFKASGKPVYVSLDGGDEESYLLASPGSRIAMPAVGHLQLDGLSASAFFLRGTYDKLGIRPNFAHVGRYKSAVEQYTRETMSPDSRASLEAMLDDVYGVLVDSLAVSRGVSSDSLHALIDDGPYLAEEAYSRGLVDTLLAEADLDSLALRRAGGSPGTQSLADYVREEEGSSGEHIALIVANGTIVSGKSRATWDGVTLGDETLANSLREIRKRHSIRAVVLRIDSPGGSADASDAMWQELRRLRREKPVVVSMSNVAASGGYYLACGADAIVAEPATITGSIGVFGGKLNVLGLYRKLGFNVETVSRGRHAEMLSPFRDFTDEEAALYQRQLEDFYRVFLGRVAEGRSMTPASVDSVGQGRVWSGLAAKRIGLVDELGGLQDAVAVARQRAGISADADVTVEVWPRPRRSFLQRWLGDLLDERDDESAMRAFAAPIAPWFAAAQQQAGEVLAMMPFTIRIR